MSAEKDFEKITKDMMAAYHAGDYTRALELAEQASVDFPEHINRTSFWRICLLSRLNRTDESLQLLATALNEGFWWSRTYFQDEDLDAVRELPEFQRLVEASHQRHMEALEEHSPQRFVVEPNAKAPKPYPLLVALHGRSHNGKSELGFWRIANELGWLVVSLQSSQPCTVDSFCWDDLTKAEQEVLDHLEAIRSEYPIDESRIVFGGFSQGAGLAILSSLHEQIPAAGFIGIGTWAPEVAPIVERAQKKSSIRGYFVIGEQDHTLERTGEIQAVLTEAGLALTSETHPDLGHEFPSDYGKTLRKALSFITSK